MQDNFLEWDDYTLAAQRPKPPHVWRVAVSTASLTDG